MEDVILKWPEHTALYAFLTGGAFFGTFLLIFFYLYFSAQRRSRIDALWSRLYHEAIHKKVPTEEIGLLKGFFHSLADRERETLFAHPDVFRHTLLAYLARRGEDNRVRVHMISTLFPAVALAHEVRGIDDLYPEEIASIELNDTNLLIKIEEKKPSEIVLYSDTPLPDNITKGEAASIYVFRPGLGGFLLGGRIVASGVDRIVFAFDGSIDYFGEIHLMAEISVPFAVESWPEFKLKPGSERPTAGIEAPETLEEPPAEHKTAPPEEPPKERAILRLTGETVRISDRAALIRFKGSEEILKQPLFQTFHHSIDVDGTLIIEEAVFRRQENWLLRMVLPFGYHFSEQGRIIPVPARHGYYVIRYDHIPDSVKKGLMKEIRSAGAMKERLI
jgi:hypothetical protein